MLRNCVQFRAHADSLHILEPSLFRLAKRRPNGHGNYDVIVVLLLEGSEALVRAREVGSNLLDSLHRWGLGRLRRGEGDGRGTRFIALGFFGLHMEGTDRGHPASRVRSSFPDLE